MNCIDTSPTAQAIKDARRAFRERIAAIAKANAERHLPPPQQQLDEQKVPKFYPGSIAHVVHIVARAHGLTDQELLSLSKQKHLTHTRHIAMYLAHKITRRPKKLIARVFHRAHGATVQNACERVEALRARDPIINAEIALLEARITGSAQ